MSPPGPSPRSSVSSLNGLYTQTATAVDVASFKPMDPVNHPGDKESKWSLKPDQHALNFMHNAIRAEVTKFEALLFRLGNRQLKKWEKDYIKVSFFGGKRARTRCTTVAVKKEEFVTKHKKIKCENPTRHCPWARYIHISFGGGNELAFSNGREGGITNVLPCVAWTRATRACP